MDTFQEFITYVSQNSGYIAAQFYRHFLMAAYGVLFAAIVSIPLGVLIAKYGRLSGWVLAVGNIIQTIPALGMIAVIMLVLGLGPNTAVMTLFLYSILPITQNTYVGMKGVDQALVEAGRASGMTRFQLLRMVELPLAISVIMAGLRNALVVGIGIAAIGAFVGAGGLGEIILTGTNATDGMAIILAGAIPTAFMAIIADMLMGWIERKLHPFKQSKPQTS
ncbi:ABC transporter permease [Shouchella clausii]|jgi:osmoprotectant transport system permease protein|uniref:Proline/glycine betaine ABC transporter permease n=3 Tax=Shouchella TaxID=2893057 RepID=Q5WDJ4_SHOC1|nr:MULTISPECIES: ABC transporter permease [Shouchella]MCM3313559.1 ABC transporter permease [Psychrobacillus sp. MER TA 17]PAD41975.1 amino acid ABC transporter permease [Bacillus sp. 7520-S]ALA54093.1 Osmotically activated L-carnitine/choline ABC transporter, permease protein OpuCD [Shouchella clausii]AST96759.1 amino acid ABC transporter permease [Shouchella clausii]KKI85392.1 amino acid ABC transporter permease [Shouchella clausii]